MNKHLPWEYLLLSILSEGQKELREIYTDIEEVQHDIGAETNSRIVNPGLFDVDVRYDNRPKYTHTVRSYLTKLTNSGRAERAGRGLYRITQAGRDRLTWFNNHY